MNQRTKSDSNPFIGNNHRIIRLLLAVVGASSLFLILPVTGTIIKKTIPAGITKKKDQVILMQRIEKEEKTSGPDLHPIRSMSSKIGPSTTETRTLGFSMHVAPDLSVGSSGDGVTLASSGSSDVVFNEGEVDELPKPIRRIPVDYPQRAKEAGIEGTVSLVVLIGSSGDVLDISIESAPSQLFNKPVIQAVKQWKFIPGRNKGVPVKVRMRLDIEFKLEPEQ